MSPESLEAAVQRAGGPVEALRSAMFPPHEFPVARQFTNWRSEQAAWRETCALLDQSHHMNDLFVRGRDALAALSHLGVNTFENFEPGKAKQYVATNSDGYCVGDAILFYLDEQEFDLVGNGWVTWVQYQVENGDFDATCERDQNSARRVGPPKLYRYELQGPTAAPLVERLIGGELPDVKFFNMATFEIGGREVRALRHGMAGQPGFELFGPWDEGEAVRDAILEVGDEFGLLRAGAMAYSTANLESGWIPTLPVPVFGEGEKEYREWVPAAGVGSLAGSMDSDNIRDYCVTPYDIGYGHLVKFDHDFVGRGALEKLAESPRRDKVTLVWNVDDVIGAMRSEYDSSGLPAKSFEIPKSRYGFFQVDKVLRDGELVGTSMDVGYIANERAMISLASVDVAVSEPGTEVVVLWGEGPDSINPRVEPHRQVEIRAIVAPAPYPEVIREAYRTS